MLKKNKFRLITNVLTAAIKLWLRTQVSHVEQLQVEIIGGDRQIISGSIPSVSIVAQSAVYQGLHLSFVNLLAKNIRINISSILKGQQLRLLEKVPVSGELNQLEADLSASLSSKLLSTALNDVLIKLLPEYGSLSKSTSWQKVTIKDGILEIFGIIDEENNPQPLDICLGLKLLSHHELIIAPLIVTSNTKVLHESHNGEYINLGSDVEIQELQLIPGKIICRGKINVNP
ncbi:DUF2993 domain-containing protein [Rivularia sp. UHCC 0363]|uniref:LmeA family phospholipid-binding protein n=1 Tax=Rivularia sp. UHCC 0363 TaxID=3110244 RepID=UPI002B1FE5CD|nr:DUF2993 domain-containing protein [Rivularia sp. UHCC 0363]MEA5593601.1 DUF2993 domain-containing protein [Rivularia sp. UHCC 0363]